MMGCISENGTLPLPGHMRGPSKLEIEMQKRGCTCRWLLGSAAIVVFEPECPVLREHRGVPYDVLGWDFAIESAGAIFQ